MDRPLFTLGFVLLQLYIIADVLFTGGGMSAALIAWAYLTIWMAAPWLAGARERWRDRAHA